MLACTTSVQVSLSFGGKSWPISTDDMNLGTVGDGLCLGGIFDLGLGSNIGSGGGNPSWVVGDTFLVRNTLTRLWSHTDMSLCRKTSTRCSVRTLHR